MIPDPPPGQGPIDPRGAFSQPPPPPSQGAPQQQRPSMPPQLPPPIYPPMGMMPGPYPYPPPRPKGGFARGIFLTLATSIFGFSLLLNIYLLIAVGLAGDASHRTVLVKGDSSEQVAVIPVNGVITEATYNRFDKLLRELGEDSSIKVIVLEIDTPGGELTATDEMYDRLLRFKQEKNIKVVVSMGGYATSGGYYLACAADYIFAQPTSLTANIGVVYERFNFSGLMSKYGVEDTSITPAGSKYKNVESPFRPDTPETRAYLQTLVEAHYGRFKDIVKTGRGPKLKATIDVVADGRALTSDAAKQLGLIDDIGYLDAAYNKAASLAGLSKMHVVRYSPPKGLVEMLSSGDATSWLSFNASSQASPAIKLDRSLLDELTVPRMMSIYRGQ